MRLATPKELAETIRAGTFPTTFSDLDEAAEAALSEMVARLEAAESPPARWGRRVTQFTVAELEAIRKALTQPWCWKPAVVDAALRLVERELGQPALFPEATA